MQKFMLTDGSREARPIPKHIVLKPDRSMHDKHVDSSGSWSKLSFNLLG